MQIGILQTGESPDALRADMGDYPDFFETLLAGKGLTFRRWAVLRNDFPASVTDCDGWLITGSRFGAYEPHDWIPPLEDFIRAAYAAHVPVVGICFGHQIIAQAMGGKVEKYAGGWSDCERARRTTAALEKAAANEAARVASPGDKGPVPKDVSPSSPGAKDGSAPRKRVKLSFNEVRELDALPAQLEALEQEQAALAAKLADPATYASGTADPRKLTERHDAIDAELARLLARWEELEAKKTAAG